LGCARCCSCCGNTNNNNRHSSCSSRSTDAMNSKASEHPFFGGWWLELGGDATLYDKQ
jgi:hypothetical protein